MARFDVYPWPDTDGFLLDVQADILDGLNTRIVVPLLPPDTAPTPALRLNPVLEILSSDYVMATQFMSAVPQASLGAPVANLTRHDATIIGALDFALTGV